LIEIIIDTWELHQTDEDSLVVVDEKSYIESRRLIIKELNSKRKKKIHVKNSTLADWYRDLKNKKEVTYIIVDPREKLKEFLQINWLPVELEKNPHLIISLDLFKKKKPQKKVEDVWDWILSEECGPCWGEISPSWEHFTSICNYYLQKKNIKYVRTINEKLNIKKERWIKNCSDIFMKNAYKWLFDLPIKNSELVYEYKLLEDYQDKKEIIKELNKTVALPDIIHEIIPKIDKLSECKYLNDKIDEKIEIYWRSKFKEKDKDLNSVIDEMSGRLKKELDVLLEFLNENLDICEHELETKIFLKFKELSNIYEKIKQLGELIRPTFPEKPKTNWNFGLWSKWIIYKYFPYRWWLQRNDKEDLEFEQYSIRYSDWLYRNYPNFLEKFEPLVFGISHYIKKLIKKNYKVIWAIIDNLSWEYVDYLVEAFKKYKINPTEEIRPRISMLPSETYFSKPCIVAGKKISQITNPDLQYLLCERFNEFNPLYLGKNIKNFNNLYTPSTRLILILNNYLDEFAHKPEWSIPDRNKRVRHELNLFAEQIGDLIKEIDCPEKTRIIISTDHGSTKIIGKGKEIRLSTSVMDNDLIKNHPRFIYMDEMNSLNEDEWYVLDKEKFKLKNSMGIVKGYKYICNQPKGFTHGGMTPEETLIPLIEFEIKDFPKCKTPELYHIGRDVLIESNEKFDLKIENSNNRALINLEIDIPKSAYVETIKKIDALSSTKLKAIPIRISKQDDVDNNGVYKLEAKLSFTFLSRKEIRPIEIDIRTKRMFEREKGFEEIFEE